MKILVTAYACTPHYGSEHYVGWTWIKAIAHQHDVWLICGDKEVAHIEKERERGGVPARLRLIVSPGKPIEPWHPNRFVSRLQAWTWPIAFEKDVPDIAAKLHAEIGFDAAHVITIASWRMNTLLWRLPIPLVRGPMGGGEPFPAAFFSLLGPTGKIYECLRWGTDAISVRKRSLLNAVRKPAVIIATNSQTVEQLRKLGRTKPVILCPNLLRRDRFEAIRATAGSVSRAKELLIFSGGTVEGRKGVAVILRVLRRLKDRGLGFRFIYGGSGPELPHILRLRSELGLEAETTFATSLSGEEYLRTLCAAHIFLFPSLRDNGPLTLLEAMSAGTVPVVVKNGGPGDVVDESCGYAFPADKPQTLVERMADCIVSLAGDFSRLEILSATAIRRVEENYLDEKAATIIEQAYSMIQNGR